MHGMIVAISVAWELVKNEFNDVCCMFIFFDVECLVLNQCCQQFHKHVLWLNKLGKCRCARPVYCYSTGTLYIWCMLF